MSPDALNAGFESTASAVAIINIAQLLHDKDAKGFNVWSMLWWLAYGCWFIFYYDAISQRFSCIATIVWVMTYGVQTALSFYYRGRRSTLTHDISTYRYRCQSCDFVGLYDETKRHHEVTGHSGSVPTRSSTTAPEDILYIRCMKHCDVPQYNRNEASGAECPACEIEDLAAALPDIFDRMEGTLSQRFQRFFDFFLPDILNRPIGERIQLLIARADREATLAVKLRNRAEEGGVDTSDL